MSEVPKLHFGQARCLAFPFPRLADRFHLLTHLVTEHVLFRPGLPAPWIGSAHLGQLDLRVSKAITTGKGTRVELIGQVFNVLGRANLGGLGSQYITNVRSDSFGRILTSLPRQQGEVALRFVF